MELPLNRPAVRPRQCRPQQLWPGCVGLISAQWPDAQWGQAIGLKSAIRNAEPSGGVHRGWVDRGMGSVLRRQTRSIHVHTNLDIRIQDGPLIELKLQQWLR
jgi:hypothetical protein